MRIIRIQTTQNVVVEYEAGSVGSRILARIIDWFAQMLWTIVLSFLGNRIGYGQQQIWNLLLVLGPVLFYHPLCEIFFNGQSLGKRAMQLRVVRLDGTRPRLGDFLLRWLIGLIEIDMSLGLIGLVTILLNGRGQRLGDIAGHTTVVSLRRRASPDLQAALDLPPDYEPVFPQAAQLTDHDTALVQRLLRESLKRDNYVLLNEAATKVKALTSIQTDLPDEVFLQTILRDHAHLARTGWDAQ